MDDDWFDPMEAGTAYALYRHGQDRQAQQIVQALQSQQPVEQKIDVHVHVHSDEDEKGIQPVNALDFATTDMPESWDKYIGQEPLKRQLMVALKSAQSRGERFPHTLLASGFPGVGKTTMARLIAKSMNKKIIELVPPFNIYTLVAAAQQLGYGDVLFIDEVHRLAQGGKRGAEILLKVLEDGVAFLPDGSVVELNGITVVAATTDKDMLPEPVVDRFPIQPYFQPYSFNELCNIASAFVTRHDCWNAIDDNYDLIIAIADACRGVPRIAEQMVLAARDLEVALGRVCVPKEMLEFLEVEPDGLTRTHIHYLVAMRQYFARETKDGGTEYVIGEPAIRDILRETKQGLGRIERFLIERGLIDRTPRGRRLTKRGLERAEQFIREGKGV
jgi:holliday junction DNA helicase RuvB